MRCLLLLLIALTSPAALGGDSLDLDEGWSFHVGEADLPKADDPGWRLIDLPHDAAMEFAPNPSAPTSGGGGYLRSGVIWYRRDFLLQPEKLRPQPPGARLRLEFDGATRHTEVWLNGEPLGRHSYDYTPLAFDITERVRWDAPNAVLVKIDSSAQPASRWHAGWGITRHVRISVDGEVSVAPHSLWASTVECDGERAVVEVRLDVASVVAEAIPLRVTASLESPAGKTVATRSKDLGPVAAGVTPAQLSFEVPSPDLWSAERPALYTLRVGLAAVTPGGERAIDSVTQRIGLRTVTLDPERGLLVSGEPVKLFGGNVHHDNGPLGAASFDDAELRKARLLKGAGFNAVRTAHNPPSEAFLDACDAVGLYVLDEAFDAWRKPKLAHDYSESFDEHWREDLEAMVRRDRRHPSVVAWSIGNEMFERGDPSCPALAKELVKTVRGLDATRPVAVGVNGVPPRPFSALDPLFEQVDIAGYNYEAQTLAADHARLPGRLMLATESYPARAAEGWRVVKDHPRVLGDFVWSAIDYLGEAGIGRAFGPGETPKKPWEADMFPYRAALCGDLDLVGNRRPISHLRSVVWDRGERLHLSVIDPAAPTWGLTPWSVEPAEESWTWKVPRGAPLRVQVASRWPRVRLELNGRPVGEAMTGEGADFSAEIPVPYEPGELVALGLDQGGEEAERFSLVTADEVVAVAMKADREAAPAHRQSLVFVGVSLVDAEGRVQPREDRVVRFSVEGVATLQAVGNGDPICQAPYAGSEFPSHRGRLLAVLRSTGKPGRATLVAHSEGLPDQRLEVEFLPR